MSAFHYLRAGFANPARIYFPATGYCPAILPKKLLNEGINPVITRIVRMEFQQAHAEDFLDHFRSVAPRIRAFPGVRHLELHRDAAQPNIFYTYSLWDGESDLESYRQSELFRNAWRQAKSWFSGKPHAFSMRRELVLE
jgi:quinol monooxygenase YgiN